MATGGWAARVVEKRPELGAIRETIADRLLSG
jgi:hypothetical protein